MTADMMKAIRTPYAPRPAMIAAGSDGATSSRENPMMITPNKTGIDTINRIAM